MFVFGVSSMLCLHEFKAPFSLACACVCRTHSDEDNPYAEGYKAPAKALRWRSTKGTAGPVHDSSSSSPSPLTRPLPAVTELSGSGAGTSFSGSGPGTPLLDGPSVDGKAPAGDVAGQPGIEGVLSIQVSCLKNRIKKKKAKDDGHTMGRQQDLHCKQLARLPASVAALQVFCLPVGSF